MRLSLKDGDAVQLYLIALARLNLVDNFEIEILRDPNDYCPYGFRIRTFGDC